MSDKIFNLAPPSFKEAIQLSALLAFAIIAVPFSAGITNGQFHSLPDTLSMITGALISMILSLVPCIVLKFVSGRSLLVAVPCLIATVTMTAIMMATIDLGSNLGIYNFISSFELHLFTGSDLHIIATFYWVIYAYLLGLFLVTGGKVRAHQVELAQSQKVPLQAQLNMFRMQLNPHFMRNSLNIISNLILGRRYDDAQRMADKLAGIFRPPSGIEGLEVELRDELDLIDAYLEVEMARLGDRLHIEMVHDGRAVHALIPDFILPTLVENALRYGVQYSCGPVELRIFSRKDGDRLILTVENEAMDMPKGAPVDEMGGIGLANVRASLDLIFGPNATFESTPLRHGYRATVNIPFRCVASRDCEAAPEPMAA